MTPPLLKPKYDLKPIRDISALSLSLGMPEELLINVAAQADGLYRKAKPIEKPDGTKRQPFDALLPLKPIQRRIKDRILKRVEFPEYLTGSLSGRDYRTNAAMHAGAKIVICEDIEGFFPSTSRVIVLDIWLNFFRFSEDVANLLTSLTTKEGELPQGAITSSYLANLAFWNQEPRLQAKLAKREVVYSRYVDDIAVSSKQTLTKEEQTALIAQIYGMLKRQGYKPKRRKHETFTSGRRMLTTKLMVNRKPALQAKERQNIRAAVHALEQRIASGERGLEIKTELNRVTSRVGRLGTLHPTEAKPLKLRLGHVRHLTNNRM